MPFFMYNEMPIVESFCTASCIGSICRQCFHFDWKNMVYNVAIIRYNFFLYALPSLVAFELWELSLLLLLSVTSSMRIFDFSRSWDDSLSLFWNRDCKPSEVHSDRTVWHTGKAVYCRKLSWQKTCIPLLSENIPFHRKKGGIIWFQAIVQVMFKLFQEQLPFPWTDNRNSKTEENTLEH